MEKLEIVKIGHPCLRKKLPEVNPAMIPDRKFRDFLKEMVRLMREADGVGLAANQVGSELRVMVLECKSNERYPGEGDIPLQIYINPKITEYSEAKDDGWEGCLSVPGYRGLVSRSKEVTFEALTDKGEKIRKRATGFFARVIQHEVDHLNGIFFIDRMTDMSTLTHLDEFERIHRGSVHDE